MRFVSTLLTLWILASVVGPLSAEMISGSINGDATLTPTATPGIYAQNFTGDGDDNKYGNFTIASTSIVDFSKPPSLVFTDGSLLETFAKGTLFGTSSGDGTANGKGTATYSIDFTITGGTGIFAGSKGSVSITGTITQTSPTTETVTGTYAGTLSSVPEPSTLAMLGSMIVVFGLGRRIRTLIGRHQ